VKQTSPADTFALIVTLTDKLVAEQPRNLDLAHLRFLLNVYKSQRPKHRQRDWAAIKRRQRARRSQPTVTCP
jgi:hypothetical protein